MARRAWMSVRNDMECECLLVCVFFFSLRVLDLLQINLERPEYFFKKRLPAKSLRTSAGWPSSLSTATRGARTSCSGSKRIGSGMSAGTAWTC